MFFGKDFMSDFRQETKSPFTPPPRPRDPDFGNYRINLLITLSAWVTAASWQQCWHLLSPRRPPPLEPSISFRSQMLPPEASRTHPALTQTLQLFPVKIQSQRSQRRAKAAVKENGQTAKGGGGGSLTQTLWLCDTQQVSISPTQMLTAGHHSQTRQWACTRDNAIHALPHHSTPQSPRAVLRGQRAPRWQERGGRSGSGTIPEGVDQADPLSGPQGWLSTRHPWTKGQGLQKTSQFHPQQCLPPILGYLCGSLHTRRHERTVTLCSTVRQVSPPLRTKLPQESFCFRVCVCSWK